MASDWDDLYDFACSVYDENLKLKKYQKRVDDKIDKLLQKIEYNLDKQKVGIKPTVEEVVTEVYNQKYPDLKKDLELTRKVQDMGISPLGFEGLE